MAIIEDRSGVPGRTMAEVFEDHVSELLKEFGGGVERASGAARAAARSIRAEVGYPTRMLHASLALEVRQKPAKIAGPSCRVRSVRGCRMGTWHR